MTPNAAQLRRIADKLGEVEAGSREAEQAIHTALGLAGDPFSYTRDPGHARTLLPVGFEELPGSIRSDRVYAVCRRKALRGEPLHPQHESSAKTFPLAFAAAALRGHAALVEAGMDGRSRTRIEKQ